jgi:hypothetical protein
VRAVGIMTDGTHVKCLLRESGDVRPLKSPSRRSKEGVGVPVP